MTLEHRLHARCSCSLGLAAGRPFTLPGTTRKYERSRPFQVHHIFLDLTLDVPRKGLRGTATLDVERTDDDAGEIRLDAVGFDLGAVTIDTGAGFVPAAHTYDSETLAVTIEGDVRKAKIRVAYAATPRRGLYFLAPDEHVQGRPNQVWSQCQDEDARHWFPCHDKPHLKQTTEMRVKVPAGWRALSNGALVDQQKAADGDTFHYRMAHPHPSYLVTLVAGEFAVLDGGHAGPVPLSYLVPRGREEDGKRTFAETPRMVNLFGKVTGVPFPWEKYDQVVVSDFIFGGMENTTATTMYEHILIDERASIDLSSNDLIAHELAHQWFGDFVTCRDWSHGWLNEGFATFFEHVEREHRLGLDDYEYGVKQDQDAYLAEAAGRYQRPIVCQDYEAPIDLFDRHLYEKGGLVLHLLRRELGDATFWRGVGAYLKRHAYSVVETRDLQRALEDTSGRSLDRFFDQWVYKAGHPQLELKIDHGGGQLIIEARQTQKVTPEVPLFAFDLEIDIYPEHGEPRREVLRVERASETFALREGSRPRFLVVDPRHLVVGEVTAEVPASMLRHQLREAPTARGRWLALAGLARREDPATLRALGAVLADEKAYWGLRAEVAQTLGSIRTGECLPPLLAALATPHPKVRRAVAAALGRFKKHEAAQALRAVALKDPSYAVEAEAARALGATRQSLAFDTLVEVLDRPSWSDMIRAGAIDGLAALRDDRATPHVVARTRYGVPTRARRAAIRALPKLGGDRRTRETLEELLEDSDPHLRIDVALALLDLGDGKARGALQRALDRDGDGRVRRRLREILRDLAGGGRGEQQRLNDELEKLSGEHRDVLARLAKIEAALQKKAKSRAARPAPAATAATAKAPAAPAAPVAPAAPAAPGARAPVSAPAKAPASRKKR
jgi:aminopeptidase N